MEVINEIPIFETSLNLWKNLHLKFELELFSMVK